MISKSYNLFILCSLNHTINGYSYLQCSFSPRKLSPNNLIIHKIKKHINLSNALIKTLFISNHKIYEPPLTNTQSHNYSIMLAGPKLVTTLVS